MISETVLMDRCETFIPKLETELVCLECWKPTNKVNSLYKSNRLSVSLSVYLTQVHLEAYRIIAASSKYCKFRFLLGNRINKNKKK